MISYACTTGFQGTVLITNDHNIPIPFQWIATDGVDESLFYMIHSTGKYIHRFLIVIASTIVASFFEVCLT